MEILILINWLKDSKYRIRFLEKLNKNPQLPSELANIFDINRSSVSRVLNDLKKKGLIESISENSRTTTYFLTNLGETVLTKLKK